MSASLVRKALDETTLASDEKLDQLSKAAKKKFKPLKKKKKLSQEKLLKQNLKLLKALEYKNPSKASKKSGEDNKELAPVVPSPVTTTSSKKKGSKKSKSKKQESESVFTEEDFERFEQEYFVTD